MGFKFYVVIFELISHRYIDVIQISDNDVTHVSKTQETKDVTHVSETQETWDLDIAKIFSHIAGTFFQYEINSFLF